MTDSPFSSIISVPRPYSREGAPSCGIYLTAPKILRLNLFVEQARRAFSALNSSPYRKNMHALELRFPARVQEKERSEATALVALCKQGGIVPIIRGDLGLCVEANAEGIVLEKPGDVGQARHILGSSAIIGMDCGNSMEAAEAALTEGVDYVVFSRFFAKRHSLQLADLSLLEWWSTKTHLPAVAMGNITAQRAVTMVRSGAGFLGAGSWVWNHAKGPAQAIYLLQECIEHGLSSQRIN